jgi:hypothetical protein
MPDIARQFRYDRPAFEAAARSATARAMAKL